MRVTRGEGDRSRDEYPSEWIGDLPLAGSEEERDVGGRKG